MLKSLTIFSFLLSLFEIKQNKLINMTPHRWTIEIFAKIETVLCKQFLFHFKYSDQRTFYKTQDIGQQINLQSFMIYKILFTCTFLIFNWYYTKCETALMFRSPCIMYQIPFSSVVFSIKLSSTHYCCSLQLQTLHS